MAPYGARLALLLSLGSAFGVSFAAPAWPLKVNAGGRYLEDQNGVPFLIVADTAWCMVNGLTDAQLDTYLTKRKDQGFNAIQFMLMVKHDGCAVGGSSVDRYGRSPFTGGDGNWSNPSEQYWSRVDEVLDKVKAKDMLAMVTPAYLGSGCYYGSQGWCGVMSTQSLDRMTGFGAFLGQRYKTQGNIVWVAGGDASPTEYTGIDARVDALMSALTAADTSHQLVVGHARRNISGFQGFGTHAWLTINSAYDGERCQDSTMAAQIATEYARTPVQPVHSIEQTYEYEGANEQCLADQFLWSALGGGVGQTYGHLYVWSFASDWNSAGTGVNSPIVGVHTNAGKLVRSRKYWLFTPDYAHTVVTSGYGSGVATVATSRASTGETVMAYVPISGTQISLDMTTISGTGAKAYWYDPLANVATLIGTYATTGSVVFTSPGPARVLVVDDASRGYPPPASADAPFGQGPPGAVAGVQVSKVSGGVRVAWTSQNPPAGTATGYDVVTGWLSSLRAAGYGGSTCLANDDSNTPYDDMRSGPSLGDAYFYFVRATGASGAGTYGPAALDASSPCL